MGLRPADDDCLKMGAALLLAWDRTKHPWGMDVLCLCRRWLGCPSLSDWRLWNLHPASENSSLTPRHECSDVVVSRSLNCSIGHLSSKWLRVGLQKKRPSGPLRCQVSLGCWQLNNRNRECHSRKGAESRRPSWKNSVLWSCPALSPFC